jgi:hypothetical protein
MKKVEKFVNIKFVNDSSYDHFISICSNTQIINHGMSSYTKISLAPDNNNMVSWVDTNIVEKFSASDSKNSLLYSFLTTLGISLPPSNLQDKSVLQSPGQHEIIQLCVSHVQEKRKESKDICEAVSFLNNNTSASSAGIKLITVNDRIFTKVGELINGSIKNESLEITCQKSQDSSYHKDAVQHCVNSEFLTEFSTLDMNGLRILYGNGPENYEGAIDVPASEAKLIGYVTGDDF